VGDDVVGGPQIGTAPAGASGCPGESGIPLGPVLVEPLPRVVGAVARCVVRRPLDVDAVGVGQDSIGSQVEGKGEQIDRPLPGIGMGTPCAATVLAEPAIVEPRLVPVGPSDPDAAALTTNRGRRIRCRANGTEVVERPARLAHSPSDVDEIRLATAHPGLDRLDLIR
jgi:hypothetical protein